MDISLLQGVTLIIAVLGAVLGIINMRHEFDKSRIKLLVRPKHAIPVGNFDTRITFCIEVINLSAFAITIEDVGVLFKGTKDRGSIIGPIISDGGKLPRRLEPRSSVTIYCQKPSSPPGHAIKCAYAKTECGYTKTGTSPAFKQIAQNKS